MSYEITTRKKSRKIACGQLKGLGLGPSLVLRCPWFGLGPGFETNQYEGIIFLKKYLINKKIMF